MTAHYFPEPVPKAPKGLACRADTYGGVTAGVRNPPGGVNMSNGSERRQVAWIGKAVKVEGKVVSAEDLTIDGNVQGSIELGGHSLTIGPDADITADLVAKTVTISGKVTGNVMGVEKVDLQATGSVNGDITAPRFAMADGAMVTGRVQAGS
jgi:cytoskeletal protein CcmA (bactofilin family)